MKEIKGESIYFNQLDGLRCFAVCAVFISHWISFPLVEKIPFGSMGVNLFFVLSGFLISRILFLSKENVDQVGIAKSLKIFYVRRTLRIFPIYYLLLFLLLLMNFQKVNELFMWLFTYTLNIKFALPNVWESRLLGAYDHLWSLSAEEQFYVFYPIAVFSVPFARLKSLIYMLILIGLGSRLLIFLFDFPLNAIYVFPTTCFDSFGVGAILAYLYLYDKEKLLGVLENKKYFFYAFFSFVAIIVFSRLFIDGYRECRTVIERFSFSVVCFWIVGWGVNNSYSGKLKNLIELNLVVFLGKISYGLYIYHNFIGQISIIKDQRFFISSTLDNVTKAFIYFVITVIISSLSFYIIEKPINNFKNKFNQYDKT
jgi:peptidoglycan/LPS O-acetylase OafA/YrhL